MGAKASPQTAVLPNLMKQKQFELRTRCNVVLGPYGSDSTRAVARAADGRVVWNHGAAADDVQRLPGVVSLPSPASRYLVALGRAVAELRPGARVAVVAASGRFAAYARDGLAREAAALFESSVWRGAGVAPGDGRPVMLIPGFLAGDGSLATMTGWLRAAGYHTRRAGIRVNVRCSEDACARLERRLEDFADVAGERVAIVGQSRGGVLARALAARRPELVSGIVTLGSPTVAMLRAHPFVLLNVGVVGALGTAHVPGLFSLRCLRGGCCTEFRAALTGPFPPDVRFVAVYSKRDGVVDWRACLDPYADEHVEVRASHIGMAVNRAVYAQVARALGAFAERDETLWAQAA
jgi:pimeloyl-ACP methyl ester carboxylesterase